VIECHSNIFKQHVESVQRQCDPVSLGEHTLSCGSIVTGTSSRLLEVQYNTGIHFQLVIRQETVTRGMSYNNNNNNNNNNALPGVIVPVGGDVEPKLGGLVEGGSSKRGADPLVPNLMH